MEVEKVEEQNQPENAADALIPNVQLATIKVRVMKVGPSVMPSFAKNLCHRTSMASNELTESEGLNLWKVGYNIMSKVREMMELVNSLCAKNATLEWRLLERKEPESARLIVRSALRSGKAIASVAKDI